MRRYTRKIRYFLTNIKIFFFENHTNLIKTKRLVDSMAADFSAELTLFMTSFDGIAVDKKYFYFFVFSNFWIWFESDGTHFLVRFSIPYSTKNFAMNFMIVFVYYWFDFLWVSSFNIAWFACRLVDSEKSVYFTNYQVSRQIFFACIKNTYNNTFSL